MKQRLSVPQQLGYKYIVCISGNDRASNTNWVVASNSVPIFAKPRFHSWVCEPWLKPNVHYVEVKEDFSDFPEKIEWCQAHDKECEEIDRNGKELMEQNFTKELVAELISHLPTPKSVILNLGLNLLPYGTGTIVGGVKDSVELAISKRSWVSLL